MEDSIELVHLSVYSRNLPRLAHRYHRDTGRLARHDLHLPAGWSELVKITFNDQDVKVSSIEELSAELSRFDAVQSFELWIQVVDGPLLSMLRNGPDAFLMYLRFTGDAGYTSRTASARAGSASFQLANGQIDEYPLSWCIDLEWCYQAIAYFFVNDGAKPDWIVWHEE